jgi:hypothetical protein
MSQPVHEPTGLYCQLMLSRLRIWFAESAYRFCCSGACIHIYAPSDSFVELDLVSSSMIQTVRIGTLLWYINGTFLFLGTALPRQSYFQTFFFFFFPPFWDNRLKSWLGWYLRHATPIISNNAGGGCPNKLILFPHLARVPR